MNTIFTMPGKAPSYPREAIHVLAALYTTEPTVDKIAKNLYKEICKTITDDMEAKFNTAVDEDEAGHICQLGLARCGGKVSAELWGLGLEHWARAQEPTRPLGE